MTATETAVCVMCAWCALLAGCSKEGGSGAGAAASASAVAKSDVKAPPSDPIGVAECDDYFKQADECFAKKPDVKASFGNLVGGQRDAWKASAATPEGKETLKAVCAASLDDLKQKCK